MLCIIYSVKHFETMGTTTKTYIGIFTKKKSPCFSPVASFQLIREASGEKQKTFCSVFRAQ